MKFDRYAFIILIVIMFFSILTYSYAKLTLVEGAEYRKISDEKRIREILITPPRGEIFDRNGKLLAGNKVGFTVQLQKDALNALPKSEKNDICLSLIRLLEADGADYLNDYPIKLNSIAVSGNVEVSPEDYIINLILENGLLEEYLSADKYFYENTNFYRFTIGDRILKACKAKEGDIPLEFVKNSDAFILKFKDNVNLKDFYKSNGIEAKDNPYALLNYYIEEDKSFAKKALSNSIVRRTSYEFLKSKGLGNELTLKDFSLSFDEKLIAQKAYLKSLSPAITDETSATFDFCAIFDEKIFPIFIEKIYPPNENRKEPFSIQKEAVRFLNENGIETNIEVSLSNDGSYHLYNYRNGFEVGDKTPGEIILQLLRDNNMVRDFLTDKKIRFLAQGEMINEGINAGISISDVPFEYTSMREKKNFLESEQLSEIFMASESPFRTDKRRQANQNKSPKFLFYLLREKYEISPELSDYEARAMFGINQLIKSRGYMAYQPINFAYNVSDETVAFIEESFGQRKGVSVSVEPIRYYPYNNIGSHVLGYIGKISQDYEIEEFVNEKGYQKSDFIGKTGLENAMEDKLRGIPGKKIIEVDAVGNTTDELEEKLPLPGNSVYSTIDIELQAFAEEKLTEIMKAIRTSGTYESPWGDYKYQLYKENGVRKSPQTETGVVLVQKVDTGEILAMASVPSFNPNLFAKGISAEDFQSLFPENEEDLLAPRPLLNIATQSSIQPGSVFKMITGLAALEKGFSPKKRIPDRGYVEVGETKHKCWYYAQYGGFHGSLNMADALEKSCNYFFYTLALGEERGGRKVGIQLTIDDINNMAKRFGLGERTGVEIKLPAEQKGILPNKETKKSIARSRLNYYLRNNIDEYVNDKEIYNKEEAIREILSWLDDEEEKSRGEIISGLTDLGLEPLKPLPGRKDGLCDLIKFTYFIDAKWGLSNTLNATIGQGEVSTTPLQISNYISTIANGGKKYKTSLVKAYEDDAGLIIENKSDFEEVGVSKENLDVVKQGMYQVVNHGYLRNIFKSIPIKISGKTGSAQKTGINPATGEEYSSFAWFSCFAPSDEPEICVTTLIFQGRTASNVVPLARDVVAEYFKLKPPDKKAGTVQSSGNQE